MAEFANVGAQNFGYVTGQPKEVNGRIPNVYVTAPKHENDSYKGANKKHTATTLTLVSIPVIAAAGLWLTKGKGWSKIKNMLGRGSKIKTQTSPATTVPQTSVPTVPTAGANAEAHQIGNLIPEQQAAALRAAVSSDSSKLNGVFKTKKGYTATYKDGNLQELITPDGRKITKQQTLHKYQDKVDVANLTPVAA